MSRTITGTVEVDVNGENVAYEVELLHVDVITGDHFLRYWTTFNANASAEMRLKSPGDYLRGRVVAFMESTVESLSYTDGNGLKTAVTKENPLAAPLNVLTWLVAEADDLLAKAFTFPNRSSGTPSGPGLG